MFSSSLKQCLSFFLALVMLFSLFPVSVFATETEQNSEPLIQPMAEENNNTDTDDGTTPAAISVTESQQIDEPDTQEPGIQERIDAILVQYGITAEMTDNDIANAINAMDGDTLKATMAEMAAIEEDALSMTEEELAQLDTDLYGRFCDVMERLYSAAPIAQTVKPITGVSVTDSIGNGSLSGETVTIQAKGSLLSKKTNNITITNESSSTATLSFDYTTSKANSFTIDGTASTSGSFSKSLNAGASVTLVLVSNSGLSNTTATLTLSNFKLIAADAAKKLTVSYDNGSVTVDGAEVENDSTTEIKEASVELKATGDFVAWVDSNSKILSTENPYTLNLTGDISVKAVITSDACFKSTGDILYEDLNSAIAAKISPIILVNNGTLSAGDYTIPSGVTLLIPYDSANTLCTTAPTRVAGADYYSVPTTPSAYRTLTMANGANITVNGAISVSATQLAGGQIAANVHGPAGFIKMESGSTITVNADASLYAWGYITGSGSVTAKSKAKIYENFQFMDWRGGDVSNSMANDTSHGVFPMSQYYVQNIEVPLKLEAGAIEYADMSVNVSYVGIKDTKIPFIGSSNSMFNISSGYVIKDYDENSDRLLITICGNVSLDSISISLQVQILGKMTIDSAKKELPINSNMTVDIQSGNVTINQDIALLPGSKIIVGASSNVILGSGVSIYIYDQENWAGYAGLYNSKFLALRNAPGRKYTRKESDLIDAAIEVNGTVDASKGYVYCTTSGANIYSTANGQITLTAGTQDKTYQFHQYDADSSKAEQYIEIPITPAQLKHGDGTHLQSEAGTYRYNADHGKWVLGEHEEKTVSTATCTTAGQETTSCPCGYSSTTDVPALGHAFTDAVCSRCGEKILALSAAECSYDSEVILRMKFFIPDDYLNGDYTIRLTKDGRWGEKTEEYPMAKLKEHGPYDEKGRYWAWIGVASGEMTRAVTTEILDADGNPVTFYNPAGTVSQNSFDYTVRDYVAAIMKSSVRTENEKAAAKALAVFGGYAQQYFNVDADDPAYTIDGLTLPDLKTITADTLNYGVSYSGENAGIKVKSLEAVLDSATSLRVKFVLDSGADINSYTFTVVDETGAETQIDKVGYDTDTGRYYVDVEGIDAVYLDSDYTVNVKKDGTTVHTVTASVMSWAKLIISKNADENQVNMAKALYLYNQAADTLFPE